MVTMYRVKKNNYYTGRVIAEVVMEELNYLSNTH
jgi:hypothetical protein